MKVPAETPESDHGEMEEKPTAAPKAIKANVNAAAAKPPATRKVDASRAELARMVGLPDDALADEPLWVNTGVEQLVIPIRSAELVRAAQPVPQLIAKHGYSESRDEAISWQVRLPAFSGMRRNSRSMVCVQV